MHALSAVRFNFRVMMIIIIIESVITTLIHPLSPAASPHPNPFSSLPSSPHV